jgi:hypothetical protein
VLGAPRRSILFAVWCRRALPNSYARSRGYLLLITRVFAILSSQPCFSGSQMIHRNPRASGIAETM